MQTRRLRGSGSALRRPGWRAVRGIQTRDRRSGGPGPASRCQMIVSMDRPAATMAFLARRPGDPAVPVVEEGVGPGRARDGPPCTRRDNASTTQPERRVSYVVDTRKCTADNGGSGAMISGALSLRMTAHSRRADAGSARLRLFRLLEQRFYPCHPAVPAAHQGSSRNPGDPGRRRASRKARAGGPASAGHLPFSR
jgi:hypothetical protein